MKRSKNILAFAAALCLLVFVALSCNSGKDTRSENTTPIPNNNAASTPANDANASAASIAGDYTVTGTNVDGTGKYVGGLTITPRDDVYQFSWDSGGRTYDGVGVMTGKKIAVAFTNGTDGSGCGVVLYKVLQNGDLDGKAGYWGINSFETETAKRLDGDDKLAHYEVTGKNTEGGAYKGTLKIQQDGEGYSFEWNTGSILKGFGIQQDETATVGIGGPQCAFVAYDIKPDGSLEGKWGGQTTKTFGTEIAKKK